MGSKHVERGLMAAVSRDPRGGRWLARWRDPSGRQRKKSFRRKIDAQRWLDQMQADRHRGQYIDPSAGKVRVGTFATDWLNGLAHLKPSTKERYRIALHRHVLPLWGRWSMGTIRHSDVTGWIGGLAESGLKPGSVWQIHRVFSLLLDAAVRDGRLARNPALGVPLPRQVRAEPRFLNPREVACLIEAAGDDGVPIAVLAFTGLRFGELSALRIKRVDLLRCRLTIAESATVVGGVLRVTTPKTH